MKKSALLSFKLLIVAVLIAATTIGLFSCAKKDGLGGEGSAASDSKASAPSDTETTIDSDEQEKKITITVEVKGPDEKTETFTIETDADNLGDALQKDGLVLGEESEYGLYIKTVNGITADYDTDGAYWALYKGGEYLTSGAESTPISDGDSFEIVYTVG